MNIIMDIRHKYGIYITFCNILYQIMEIEHIAIWAKDIEDTKEFCVKYFGLTANEKYHNPKKNFSSYLLSF